MKLRRAKHCAGFKLESVVLKESAFSHSKGFYDGAPFHDGASILECSNLAAACIPELREKYGAVPFADDHPSICRVIRSFCIIWNNGLSDDETRTRLLKPYVTRILGTERGKSVASERAWMAADWQIRTCAPAFLRLIPSLRSHADVLEAVGELNDVVAARAAQAQLDAAREAAGAAVAAAWPAASDASRKYWWAAEAADNAWDTRTEAGKEALAALTAAMAVADAAGGPWWDRARWAAKTAAMGTALEAAEAAAMAADCDAAEAAAMDAAMAVARDAASDAAMAAAGIAAREAVGRPVLRRKLDASLPEAVARAALAPTVATLQTSALDLLDRMMVAAERQVKSRRSPLPKSQG